MAQEGKSLLHYGIKQTTISLIVKVFRVFSSSSPELPVSRSEPCLTGKHMEEKLHM